MEQTTQIQVKLKTVERLKKCKLVPMESYDNIINRILDKVGEELKK